MNREPAEVRRRSTYVFEGNDSGLPGAVSSDGTVRPHLVDIEFSNPVELEQQNPEIVIVIRDSESGQKLLTTTVAYTRLLGISDAIRKLVHERDRRLEAGEP